MNCPVANCLGLTTESGVLAATVCRRKAFRNGFVDEEQFRPKRVPPYRRHNETDANPDLFFHVISSLDGF